MINEKNGTKWNEWEKTNGRDKNGEIRIRNDKSDIYAVTTFIPEYMFYVLEKRLKPFTCECMQIKKEINEEKERKKLNEFFMFLVACHSCFPMHVRFISFYFAPFKKNELMFTFKLLTFHSLLINVYIWAFVSLFSLYFSLFFATILIPLETR